MQCSHFWDSPYCFFLEGCAKCLLGINICRRRDEEAGLGRRGAELWWGLTAPLWTICGALAQFRLVECPGQGRYEQAFVICLSVTGCCCLGVACSGEGSLPWRQTLKMLIAGGCLLTTLPDAGQVLPWRELQVVHCHVFQNTRDLDSPTVTTFGFCLSLYTHSLIHMHTTVIF